MGEFNELWNLFKEGDDENIPNILNNLIEDRNIFNKYGNSLVSIKSKFFKLKKSELSGIDIEDDLNKIRNSLFDILNQIEKDLAKSPNTKLKIRCEYLYLITATESIIKLQTPEHILSKFKTSDYYGNDHNLWTPYTPEKKSIGSLIKDLGEKGYKFKNIYLHENEHLETRKQQLELSRRVNESVVIVDLLAINKVNEPLAREFDSEKIVKLIFPIHIDLDRTVRHHMENIKTSVFPKATYIFEEETCYFYETNYVEYHSLYQILTKILKQENSTNQISDNESERNSKIKEDPNPSL